MVDNESGKPGDIVAPYRLVRYGADAYLYSSLTDQIYPLAADLAAKLGSAELAREALSRIETASCGRGIRPAPPPPEHSWVQDRIRRALNHGVQQVILGITEECNLRCRYCVYSGDFSGVRSHSRISMSWDVARKAIDHLLLHADESTVPPGISFYGGEALIELPLIRRCVEYAESRSSGKARFVITTNGTLLGREAREFAVEHNFTLLVSLDGPREIHDRYRRDAGGRPTFDRVAANLAALKREAPDYYARQVRFSVVLAPPVEYADLLTFFDESEIACMVSPLDSYGASLRWEATGHENFKVLASACEQLCLERKSAPGMDVARRFVTGVLGPTLRRLQTRTQRPDHVYHWLGQCIPGVRKFFVNPSGNIYPCEKVEGAPDVLIGHVDTGVDPEAVERLLLRFVAIVKNQCGKCWMRRMCSGCLADVVQGGSFAAGKMHARCASRQEAQAEVLGLYASLLQADPEALSFLSELFPWE